MPSTHGTFRSKCDSGFVPTAEVDNAWSASQLTIVDKVRSWK